MTHFTLTPYGDATITEDTETHVVNGVSMDVPVLTLGNTEVAADKTAPADAGRAVIIYATNA
jgi:hypothetical protein